MSSAATGIPMQIGSRASLAAARAGGAFAAFHGAPARICPGRWPFPPEIEFASRLGVSRATVRLAMQRLVQEGVLVRKRNAGTRVSNRHLKTSFSDWEVFPLKCCDRECSCSR
jgi:hypothetical protein